ncbi:MAG TPA: hypothetical protein VFR67_03135 [Pilimelia sp.]|nr:hypothetical protein [Pilimelia sp.]
MAQIELSITESFAPPACPPATSKLIGSVPRWAATVAEATEPCLVIDTDALIVATSESCCTLLGLGDPETIVGRFLLEGVLRLVDFTAARGELTEAEIDKIPPLLALSSGRLARGLMRVHDGADGGLDATVDAIATPLWDGTTVVGSLTFFSAI